MHLQIFPALLMVFIYDGNCLEVDNCAIKDNETLHVKCVNNGHIRIHVPDEMGITMPSTPQEVTVKRIHSRHRRFIAPGASWQIRVHSNNRILKILL